MRSKKLTLSQRVDRLSVLAERVDDGYKQALLDQYEYLPVEYCHEVLRVRLTDQQQEIARLMLVPPCKVLVPSGNSLGKSFLAGCLVNWWFDCRHGIVMSTAPTEKHVKEILWAEVRSQRQRAGLDDYFIGPAAPKMMRGQEWYAFGFTTRSPEGFQGRHKKRMFFLMDEATAIESVIWDRMRTMFDPSPEEGHAALAIFNPINTNCRAYIEDNLIDESDDPKDAPWHRVRLNGLEHPNIKKELLEGKKDIPGAVSVAMVEGWLRDWCQKLEPTDTPEMTDVRWPPEYVKDKPFAWYRPGGQFQASCLGLWPTEGDTIWSDALWAACIDRKAEWPIDSTLPQIGCDTAQGKGEDFHAIHARWGATSFHHETANTMDPIRIAARLREVAKIAAKLMTSKRDVMAKPIEDKQIHIKIDDDGTGGAIAALLSREGYWITPIGAGCRATKVALFPRMRDQLWFSVADMAKKGQVNFSLLDAATKRRLKQQLMAPSWDHDANGKRCVEPKDDTRLKLGRSPDCADSVNLSYFESQGTMPQIFEPDIESKREEGHYGKRRARWA